LTDAPPLRTGGHGCHVLAWNWLQAMRDQVVLVVTHRLNPTLSLRAIAAGLGVPSAFFPDLCSLRCPRSLRTPKLMLELMLFRAALPRVARRIRASRAERVFALFGGAPWFLSIAGAVAGATGLPLDVYLVDDLEESARQAGQPVLARWTRTRERRLLLNAARVFAISPGYTEHLLAKYGKRAEWLPLPFPTDKVSPHPYRPRDRGAREIAFLGAVNHLYLAPLRDLLRAIQVWNRDSDEDPLRLVVMTYSSPRLVERELGRSEDLEIIHRASDIKCRERLARSWAIFLPYSFEPEHRLMVSTSFPSKLAESLPAGRPLLVYGPAYASLPRYFLENDLPLCVTDPGQLLAALRAVESYDDDALIQRYQAVLDRYHSPAVLRNRLRPPPAGGSSG
jgi:hypothetical protein